MSRLFLSWTIYQSETEENKVKSIQKAFFFSIIDNITTKESFGQEGRDVVECSVSAGFLLR